MGEINKNNCPGDQLWESSSHGENRSMWFYLVVMSILIIVGFIVGGFGSISFSIVNNEPMISLGSGVNYFWPGITVQQVGGIWFGGWGILAGVIFPFFSNAVTQTPFAISFAYLPANFIQSFLPAFIFRRMNLDPRLQSEVDYFRLFISMFFANLLGALWSVFTLIYISGTITWVDATDYFFGWFGGNMLAGVVFNFVLLKSLSQWIITTRSLVKKWWK